MKTRTVSGIGGVKKAEVFAKCSLSEEVSKHTKAEMYWVIDGREIQIQFERSKKKYELKELEEGFRAGTTVSIILR